MEKRLKILVFGNPILRIDSMPIRLLPDLRKRFPDVEFREFDPNENLEREGRDLNIIDTVQGLDRVTLLSDIDSFQSSPRISMHDFDLGYSLRLLKKLKLVDSVKIFGVPMMISKKDALEQLCALIASSLP
jgi:hypothetical protein